MDAVSKHDAAYEGGAFSDDGIIDDVPFERPRTADEGSEASNLSWIRQPECSGLLITGVGFEVESQSSITDQCRQSFLH